MPSTLQQVRRGLWLSVKWILLPLAVLTLVGTVVDERRERRDERRFAAAMQRSTCGPTPADCDATAARVLQLPPGRLPSASAFGPYRFVEGRTGRDILFLAYEKPDTREPLLLSISVRDAGATTDPTRSSVSPGGRLYAATERDGRVTKLEWWNDRYTFVILSGAAIGSEEHAAALALLDAVPG